MSFSLLGKKILSSLVLIDWKKYANDRESIEPIESIGLYLIPGDKTWRLRKSLSGKLHFQFFMDRSMTDETVNSAQFVQQLYP
jgi:hypothetical protein